ncbi:MAG: putative sensor domain DACNV-containing protein [Thermoguttaceae bacterium]
MQLPKILIIDWQMGELQPREWTPPPIPDFAGPSDLAKVLIAYRTSLREIKKEIGRGVGGVERVGDISDDGIEPLLLHAYRASFSTDEGRPVTSRIFVLEAGWHSAPPDHLFGWYKSMLLMQSFESPLQLSDERLIVRLSATLQNDGAALIVTEHAGTLVVTAIAQLDFKDAARPLLGMPHDPAWMPGLLVETHGPGNLRVREGSGEYTLLANRLAVHQSALGLAPVREWLYEVSRSAMENAACDSDWKPGRVTYPELQASIPVPQTDVRLTWSRILREAIRLGHGGAFVVIPRETPDEIHIKYRIKPLNLTEKISRVWLANCCLPDGPGNVEWSILEEKRLRLHHLISACHSISWLSTTDGCVVMDRGMNVLGFGGTINAKCEDTGRCFNLTRGEEQQVDEVLQPLGHRHRSAFNLCKKVPNSIAFVISQDGDLRVFSSDSERVYFADHLHP